MLLLVIFLGLTWLLLKIEEAAREPQPRAGRLLGLAVAAGVLSAWARLPATPSAGPSFPWCLFLVLFSGRKKVAARAGGAGARSRWC